MAVVTGVVLQKLPVLVNERKIRVRTVQDTCSIYERPDLSCHRPYCSNLLGIAPPWRPEGRR